MVGLAVDYALGRADFGLDVAQWIDAHDTAKNNGYIDVDKV